MPAPADEPEQVEVERLERGSYPWSPQLRAEIAGLARDRCEQAGSAGVGLSAGMVVAAARDLERLVDADGPMQLSLATAEGLAAPNQAATASRR